MSAATLVSERETMQQNLIVRTYRSVKEYERDAANMAHYDCSLVDVKRERVTNGCALAAILVIGALLTPFCIGLLVFLLIPVAFSTRITARYVHKVPSPARAIAAPKFGVPAPLTRQFPSMQARGGSAQELAAKSNVGGRAVQRGSQALNEIRGAASELTTAGWTLAVVLAFVLFGLGILAALLLTQWLGH